MLLCAFLRYHGSQKLHVMLPIGTASVVRCIAVCMLMAGSQNGIQMCLDVIPSISTRSLKCNITLSLHPRTPLFVAVHLLSFPQMLRHIF